MMENQSIKQYRQIKRVKERRIINKGLHINDECIYIDIDYNEHIARILNVNLENITINNMYTTSHVSILFSNNVKDCICFYFGCFGKICIEKNNEYTLFKKIIKDLNI